MTSEPVLIKDALLRLAGSDKPFGPDEYQTVMRYSRKILSTFRISTADQEDLIQDVLINVSKAENVDEPVAYFRTSLKNAVYAKSKKKKELSIDLMQADEDADTDQFLEVFGAEFDDTAFQAQVWTEYEECLDKVFDQLSDDQRKNVDVFINKRVKGKSYNEIAKATGRTSQALRTAISNFAKIWQSLIARTCPDIPPQFQLEAGIISAANQTNSLT